MTDHATKAISTLRVSPARRRLLGPAHFAFMRSLAQGISLGESWRRFMIIEGESSDPRLVANTLAWIRSAFSRAAAKEQRFGTARLLRLDAGRIGARELQLPSLEEFAQERGLEDEREADQIAAYEAEYGAANARQRRRAALVERQLDALRWLETLVAQPPRAGDAVAAWFPPIVVAKLEAADIFTIAQLVDRINGVGRQWHGSIRGLGAVKGARLVAWLHENRAPLQLTIGAHVEVKRSKLFKHELAAVVGPATDIRPIEKFIPPEDLDGRAGVYRRPQSQCLLNATTDYAAVLAWLRAKRGPTPAQKERAAGRRTQRSTGIESPADWLEHLSNTQRAYRTEAERFMLWATLQKRKALSSLTHEDCIEYRDFLAAPQPRSRWCGPRSRPRWSPLWRPFEGPLGIVAQRRAIMVLRNLFSYLQDQAYLVGNAWSHITVPNSAVQSMNVGRAFTQSQWRFLNERAAALGSESASLRLRFALSLFYATGLRISEAVAAKVDHLNWVEYPGESDEPGVEGFELTVIGKGDKLRVVPVPDDVIKLLGEYLVSRGLTSEPRDIGNSGAFLIGRLVDAHERAPNLVGATRDGRLGISATTLGEQMKQFFEECSRELLAAGDVRGAERFARATTHWLRHTSASHALASGDVPLVAVKELLGHASLNTTSAYVTTEQRQRMVAVQRFARRRSALP